jgi:multiple sugar transport system ATP-binding protein
MASLEFKGVSKVYDSSVWAVRDLNLTVADGEFMVFVGPSGCGKTTALRMLAGFESVTAGEILIDGQPVTNVSPRHRDIAMVFQNYALYPNMNVYDNIGYGLKARRVPKAERAERIRRVASMLALTDELKRKPSQLSGGQRQRVAMGRAIVRQPRAFLMDEPLSNLDARLRVRMRTEIATLQHDLGVTTVYVTHDQVEAMTMADRVAVMRGGVLQQLDAPDRVYSEPRNLFVATFIGSPAMNLLTAELVKAAGTTVSCRIGAAAFPIADRLLDENPALARSIGRPVAVGIRPDAIAVASPGDAGLAGVVIAVEKLGSEVILHIDTDAAAVSHEAVTDGLTDELLGPVGADADQPTAATTTVVAAVGSDTIIGRGDRVSLQLSTDKMHFFDLESGETLRTSTAPGSSAAAARPSGAPADTAASAL